MERLRRVCCRHIRDYIIDSRLRLYIPDVAMAALYTQHHYTRNIFVFVFVTMRSFGTDNVVGWLLSAYNHTQPIKATLTAVACMLAVSACNRAETFHAWSTEAYKDHGRPRRPTHLHYCHHTRWVAANEIVVKSSIVFERDSINGTTINIKS